MAENLARWLIFPQHGHRLRYILFTKQQLEVENKFYIEARFEFFFKSS